VLFARMSSIVVHSDDFKFYIRGPCREMKFHNYDLDLSRLCERLARARARKKIATNALHYSPPKTQRGRGLFICVLLEIS
jgi:hypothetical protein